MCWKWSFAIWMPVSPALSCASLPRCLAPGLGCRKTRPAEQRPVFRFWAFFAADRSIGPERWLKRLQLGQLPVVPVRKQGDGGGRADQRHQHVRLRVPDITLGTEKFVGALAEADCGGPFDQFVAGADRQRNADAQEAGHLAAAHVVA